MSDPLLVRYLRPFLLLQPFLPSQQPETSDVLVFPCAVPKALDPIPGGQCFTPDRFLMVLGLESGPYTPRVTTHEYMCC